MFWKSEQTVVEHRTQVTDDHQSILAWLAAGEGGVCVYVGVGGWGACLMCLGLCHVISDRWGWDGMKMRL